MNRNLALDILKIILSFMIIGIHTNFLQDISPIGTYLTKNGLFRIAIPLFLLINGFYFYSTLESNNTYHWFKHLVRLYTFWSVFYAYFWFHPTEITYIEFTQLIKTLLLGYYHLWYLPALLGAALLLKILLRYKLNIFIPTFVLFSIGVIIQYLGNYHIMGNPVLDALFNQDWTHRNFLFLAFPFFSIGFLINKHNIVMKTTINLPLLLTIAGFILLFCESLLNYNYSPLPNSLDNCISTLLICPALFLLFMKIRIKSKNKLLANCSTGIYFIHPLLISISLKFFTLQATNLMFMTIILSIAMSFILIPINNKYNFIL